jgi:PKD repeat protein
MKMRHWLRFASSSLAVLALGLALSSYGTPSRVSAIQSADGDQLAPQANGQQLMPSNLVTDDLQGVDIVSETEAWAVGESACILHYTGGSWQEVVVPGSSHYLKSVSMTGPNDGWAVGNKVMCHYENGTWTPQEELDWSNYAVEMLSATSGWVVGWEQVSWHKYGSIREYRGGSWVDVYCPTDKWLYDVSMVDANGGWIVGEDGTILRYTGGSWQLVTHGLTTGNLLSVAAVSSTEAWAVGDNGTVLHYIGGAWQAFTPSPTANTLRSVAMVSQHEGWAVGDRGTILRYTGDTWQEVSSPTNERLYDVDVLPSGEGWAVGDRGTIVHIDRPPTAAFIATPTAGLAPLDVQFTDASTGTITSRVWSFGDGATSTEQNPAHTYTSGGSYNCLLTVSNFGGSDTAQRTVTVGDWGTTQITETGEFTWTFTEEGSYPTMDPTTGKTGEVKVHLGVGPLSISASPAATVTVTSEGFTPQIVEVTVGDTVLWVNGGTETRGVIGYGPEWRVFLPLVMRHS